MYGNRISDSLGFMTYGVYDTSNNVNFSYDNLVNGVSTANAISTTGTLHTDEWLSYTPTITAETNTITTKSGTIRYAFSGKTCQIYGDVLITTAGTATGYLIVTLPFTAVVDGASIGGTVSGHRSDNKMVMGKILATAVRIYLYDGTTPIADGMRITFEGNFQVA